MKSLKLSNKLFFISSLILFVFTSITSYAQSQEAIQTTTLMITIEKKAEISLNQDEIDSAVNDLNFKDPSMGTCFIESQVISYIPYDDSAPYYGVAIVELTWNCEARLLSLLAQWKSSGLYDIWSDAHIEPFPAVTGSN